MDKAKFERYAAIKRDIARLEEMGEELKPEIVEMMASQEADQVATDDGKFVIERRRKWKFSSEVEAAEGRLKDAKAKEQADGTATYTEQPILKFFAGKEDGE